MANLRKYMFDMDFGPAEEKAAARPRAEEVETVDEDELEPPPPAPMFTEEDISLARDTAFEDGRRQGMAEAADTADQQAADALAAIARQLDELGRQQEAANDEAARNAVRVAIAAFKKMLPAAAEVSAFEEVARVVAEVVGQVLDEPRIIVRVADQLTEPLRGRLEEVAEAHGFEGRVVVQADARLVIGDCRIEWTDGGAERDQARLQAEIESSIERALAPPERRFAGEDEKDLAEPGA